MLYNQRGEAARRLSAFAMLCAMQNNLKWAVIYNSFILVEFFIWLSQLFRFKTFHSYHTNKSLLLPSISSQNIVYNMFIGLIA